jgi:hypothetical protein
VAGPGLYANIHAKRKRGEKMRKKGAKGAPKSSDFAAAKRTAKMVKGGSVSQMAQRASRMESKKLQGALKDHKKLIKKKMKRGGKAK